MKIKRTSKTNSRGSALVVSLTVAAVAAIALASYLTLVQTQTSSVVRSQSFNAAMAVTEAGVEEGMAMINSAVASNPTNPWAFTNNLAAAGWSAWGANGSSITRTVFDSNSYTSTITVNTNSGTPQVDSIGTVAYYSITWIFSSAPHPMVAAAGVTTGGSGTNVSRKVEVLTIGNGTTNTGVTLFNYGMLAKQTITFSGTTLLDSYDSSNPLYSTNGQYIASKRKDGCIIATDDAVVNSIDSSGTLKVYGSTDTGVAGTVGYSGNVSVGDLAWVNGGSSGWETGHNRNDMNMAIPDVTAPTGAGLPPSSGTLGGTNYDYLFGVNNQLYVSASSVVWSGTHTIMVSGTNVIWWLKKGMTVSGQFSLIIAPGASLQLYVGDTSGSSVSWTMSGAGVLN